MENDNGTLVKDLQTLYGKGHVSLSICRGCGKEFQSTSAGVHQMGTALAYYSDESDFCDDCEKESWRLS